MAEKPTLGTQPSETDFDFAMSRQQRLESTGKTKGLLENNTTKPAITDLTAGVLVKDLQKNLAPLGKVSAWLQEPYTPPRLKDLIPVTHPPENG